MVLNNATTTSSSSSGRGYSGRGSGGRSSYHGNDSRNTGNGNGNVHSNSNSNSGSAKKATLDLLFALKTDGKVQASFASVVEKITGYIQRTYEDGSEVAESLSKLVKVTIEQPSRPIEKAEDPANTLQVAAANELQVGHDMLHKAMITKYLAVLRTFNSNMKKAYALIHDVYCTKPLQYRIADAILVDSTITNDSIKLLETIRDLMHETIRTKYPMASLVEIQTNMLSLAQRETITMAEYHKRFKEHKDMFMQVSG
jgi:hypothetical protein